MDVNDQCPDCGSSLERHGDAKWYCTGESPYCHVMYVRKRTWGPIYKVVRESICHSKAKEELLFLANSVKSVGM